MVHIPGPCRRKCRAVESRGVAEVVGIFKLHQLCRPQEIIFKVRGARTAPASVIATRPGVEWHASKYYLADTPQKAKLKRTRTHWLVISSLITNHVTKGRPCDRLLRRRNRILPVGFLYFELMYRIDYSTFQQRKGIRLSGMQGLCNRPEARKDPSFTSFTN